ncbi:hypothetical protein JCM19000A_09820 [Silvimonas sp. JCM 19000]
MVEVTFLNASWSVTVASTSAVPTAPACKVMLTLAGDTLMADFAGAASLLLPPPPPPHAANAIIRASPDSLCNNTFIVVIPLKFIGFICSARAPVSPRQNRA